MKTLYLLRHAKSAWDQPGLSDRQRPLNKRGRRDAPRMGAALAGLLAPMPVSVSPARRARLTLEGLCDGWPELAEEKHQVEEDLYTFSVDDLVAWIRERDDEPDCLFMLGHNPACTDLVNWLTGAAALDNLPTAGFAQLHLDIDGWDQLQVGCATLARTLFPRELKNGNDPHLLPD
jgi:phosphohistidine phosphatase